MKKYLKFRNCGFPLRMVLIVGVLLISDLARAGTGEVWIMDLDETVVDSTPRRWSAYQQVLPQFSGRRPKETALALRMTEGDILRLPNRYDARALFHVPGVTDEVFIREVSERMVAEYLNPRWIFRDRPWRCADEVIARAIRDGVKIYFVSSRFESTQGRETRAWLRFRGWISPAVPERVILRPDGLSSEEFKKRALELVALDPEVRSGIQEVRRLFENEPGNLALWHERFPFAIPYFVRGAMQKDGPLPPEARIINDFCQ